MYVSTLKTAWVCYIHLLSHPLPKEHRLQPVGIKLLNQLETSSQSCTVFVPYHHQCQAYGNNRPERRRMRDVYECNSISDIFYLLLTSSKLYLFPLRKCD